MVGKGHNVANSSYDGPQFLIKTDRNVIYKNKVKSLFQKNHGLQTGFGSLSYEFSLSLKNAQSFTSAQRFSLCPSKPLGFV